MQPRQLTKDGYERIFSGEYKPDTLPSLDENLAKAPPASNILHQLKGQELQYFIDILWYMGDIKRGTVSNIAGRTLDAGILQ